MKSLEGIKVLDFTQYTSGPITTALLSDLGAEVIKLENPPYGDGNYYNMPSVNKHNSFIGSLDHGKRSVLMNVRDERQREVFYEMTKTADLVIDNFKAGTMKKLGIDYETLSQINPRIICASISGYGQDGPWAKRAAYDLVVQAVSGMMSVTGEPEGRFLKSGFSLADIATGVTLLPAVLAALYQAKQTGKGCCIDCSMLECAQLMLMEQLAGYSLTEKNPERTGNQHPAFVPYGTFTCREGRLVMLCVHNDREYESLCQALSSRELAAYETNALRLEKRAEVNRLLEEALKEWDAKELCEKMEEAKVCCVPVQDIHEADQMEQLAVRNMNQVKAKWQDGTEISIVGCPIQFAGEEDSLVRTAPVMGADTLEVLSRYVPEERVHEIYDETLRDSAEKAAQRSAKMS